MEFFYNAFLFEDVVKDGTEGDGCCVSASHHLGVFLLVWECELGGEEWTNVDHEPADDLLVVDPRFGAHFFHEII